MVPWSDHSPGIRRRPASWATTSMGGYPTQLRFATRDPDSFHEESGIRSYNRICYRPEPTSTLEKHTSGQSMHVHAQHVHALEVCAVGIRKRACTVTDRTCPETDWPCAPPHKQTSRLYDAVPPPPSLLGPTSSGVPTGHGRPHRTPRPSQCKGADCAQLCQVNTHLIPRPMGGRHLIPRPVGGIEGPASRQLLNNNNNLGISTLEGPASRLHGISARRQSGSPPDLEWGGHERTQAFLSSFFFEDLRNFSFLRKYAKCAHGPISTP